MKSSGAPQGQSGLPVHAVTWGFGKLIAVYNIDYLALL